MKRRVNFICLAVYTALFTLLIGFFAMHFETIAYSKFSFKPEKQLEIDNTVKLRNFQANKYANKVPVLMYHRILDKNELDEEAHYDGDGNLHDTIVTLNEFKKQMQTLKDLEFTTLTIPEFQAYMNKDLEVPDNSVLITFDDGFKDNYINAYPVLKKHNFNAAIFLITGNIDQKSQDYDPAEVQYMSIDDIKNSLDVFGYYGHTNKFHQLDENGVPYLLSKDAAFVKRDIEDCYKIIGDSTAFAYPYGGYDESTLEILKELDTDIAFTTKDGMASPDDHMLQIPRRGIYPDTTLDIFKNLITYE